MAANYSLQAGGGQQGQRAWPQHMAPGRGAHLPQFGLMENHFHPLVSLGAVLMRVPSGVTTSESNCETHLQPGQFVKYCIVNM